MGYPKYDQKKEPEKTRHFAIQVIIKEVERTDDSATERTIRTVLSTVMTGEDLKPLFKAARDISFVAEEHEFSANTPSGPATSDFSTDTQ